MTLLCASAGCVGTSSGDAGTSTGSSSSGAATTDGTTTASTTTNASESSSSSSTGTTTEGSSTSETGSSSGGADSSGSTTEAVAFAVTSPEFVDGGGLPHTAHIDGGNMSPALDWVGVPAGTMSFGVFLHDLDFLGGNPDGFPHSAIWNIPADATGLPADIEHTAMPSDVAGALQCRNWTGSQFGYGGPGSAANHYEFIVYALDVETLDEVDQNDSLVNVYDALEAHAIAKAMIIGQSTGP